MSLQTFVNWDINSKKGNDEVVGAKIHRIYKSVYIYILVWIFHVITYLISNTLLLLDRVIFGWLKLVCKQPKKKCLEMFKDCDRMFLMTHFYAVALSHVTWLTFLHLQSIFWRIANYLYRSNVALYCLVNFCYVPILDHVTLQFAKLCWNIYYNPFKVQFKKMENCMWCFNYFTTNYFNNNSFATASVP